MKNAWSTSPLMFVSHAQENRVSNQSQKSGENKVLIFIFSGSSLWFPLTIQACRHTSFMFLKSELSAVKITPWTPVNMNFRGRRDQPATACIELDTSYVASQCKYYKNWYDSIEPLGLKYNIPFELLYEILFRPVKASFKVRKPNEKDCMR